MSNITTPYDSSFRTMLTDCKRLVIPVVNEMFGLSFNGDEEVILHQNEVFITTGTNHERITDSNISIGNNSRRWKKHI